MAKKSAPRKIVVNGKYNYICDKPVKVGDLVKLPTPSFLLEFQDSVWVGKVTRLKSEYEGDCEKVIEVLKNKI